MRQTEWYQRLALRWERRRLATYPDPVPGFTGRVDRELVFPERPDGRQGFRLRAAGEPVLVGTRHVCDRTGPCGEVVEFHLAVGPRSRLRCHSFPREPGSLATRVAEMLAQVRAPSAVYPRRFVVEPVGTHVAGEEAVTWTIDFVSGVAAGVRATDMVFDHGDRTFTVSLLEAVDERPDARDVANQILGSWEWLASDPDASTVPAGSPG